MTAYNPKNVSIQVTGLRLFVYQEEILTMLETATGTSKTELMRKALDHFALSMLAMDRSLPASVKQEITRKCSFSPLLQYS